MTAIIYIGVLFLLILLCTIVLNIYRRHKNQELIDERVRKFAERKEEIQHELMLLEKMKEKQKAS